MTTNPSELNYATRLDKAVRPQDDFFGYTNNTWLAAHPIPDSETRWGTFNVLHDEAQKHVKEICEELQGKDFPAHSLEQQIRDFYASGMDYAAHAEANFQLLTRRFDAIDAATQATDLPRIFGELCRINLHSPWRLIVDADDKDSTKHIARLMQAKLTLPDRDYYLESSEKMQSIRDGYRTHVHQMYQHFPMLAADKNACWEAIWDFEETLAKAMRSQAELRDVEGNYHNTPFDTIAQTYPNLDFPTFARTVGWKDTSNVSVDQPEFLERVDALVHEKSLDSWKTYLKWLVLVEYGGKVSEEISDIRFEFFGRILSGTTQIHPLWKRVLGSLNAAMGEGVGKLYAARHFPEESKRQVLELVVDIRDAYRERIQTLDWMSEPTKTTALEKLANIKVLIGYPDAWRDFSQLTISTESYLGNALAAEEFDCDYWLGKLSQPTSREDWFMYAQTVNAYHDPNRLVICFPGAILQAPFFSPDAPYAANIGAIGSVIGHEFTHGFDDQGCQFDPQGNVRTWQTDDERKEFAKRAQIVIEQANKFETIPGVFLKGDLVIGESIADLGGIELAHHALLAHDADTSSTTSEGLSADQLFFISFAGTECANTRDERKRQLALSDPHPIERFRVNGMLSHCDSFYETYDVQPGDKLYRAPADRARIW